MITKQNPIIPFLLVAGLAVTQTGFADYFWDQGFQVGTWQTDFVSSLSGTPGFPISYDADCLFPELPCGTGPATGEPTSTAPVIPPDPDSRFWVVSINNEPAFENFGGGVSGVPGQAHPLFEPGHMWTYYPESFAVLVDTEAGEDFPRAHLIVRHVGPTNSHDENGEGGIPFVSFGAQANRGNVSNVGALNSSFRPHKVRFKANLFDWKTSETSVLWAFVYAISEWEDEQGKSIQRGVFLTLKHLGATSDYSGPDNPGHVFDWNWPIQESFLYPGVDWGFIDGEDLNQGPASWHCGFSVPEMTHKMTDYQFDVDFQKLFECASRRGLFRTPMPAEEVLPIKGVHWAVEMSGPEAYIWMAVHDMEMYLESTKTGRSQDSFAVIPALNEWGMIVLLMLMLGAGYVFIRR